MPRPQDELPLEKWERVEILFDQMIESQDPWAVLSGETDPSVVQAAERLYRSHQRAEAQGFLEEPITLVRELKEPKETVAARFLPGQVLAGRFAVESLLGIGGMGEVYLAYDRRLNERVAIKTIRSHLANDPSVGRRFVTEVQNARRVTHPNVCRIFDLFEDGHTPFFSMEYLEGLGLSEWLRDEHRLAVKGRVALELAEGLHAAHRNGIIHCDFKPANVLLTGNPESPRPVITDFGLARAFAAGGAANLHSLAGTLGYMAPELHGGGHASVRSDIYAFGKVLADLVPKHRLAAACTARRPEDRPASLHPVIRGLRGGTTRRIGMMAVAAAPFAALAGYEIFKRPRLALVSHQRLAFNAFRPAQEEKAAQLRDLIIIATRQSLLVSVVPDNRVRSILAKANLPPVLPADLAKLLLAAEHEGIGLVVEGTLHQMDAALRLLVQVFLPGENAPALEFTENQSDAHQLVPLADRVATRLRHEFGESPATLKSASKPLSEITSNVPEAVEYYFHGLRLYENSEAEAAITWFEQAVGADPQFALAHVSLALALTARFQLVAALPSYERAFALRYRVNQRERLWIEFQYYSFIRDNLSSLESVKRLVALYPDDATYQRNVAFAYSFLGRPRDAVQYSERSVQLDPNNNNAAELITNRAEANLYDEALAAHRDFRAQGYDTTLLDFGGGLAWMGKGDFAQARAFFEHMGSDARRDRWARLMRCAPDILEGRFWEVATALESDLAWDVSTNEQAHSLNRRSWLGHLEWIMDSPARARYQAGQLIRLDAHPPSLDPMREAALIAVEIGDLDLAMQALEKLRQIEQHWPSTRTRGVRAHIEGAVLGVQDAAGRLLSQAIGLWPDSPAIYSQVRWLARRDDTAALAACETLEQQRGRILKRHFPGLIVLGWIEKARCLARLSRFEEASRIYQRVHNYWLHRPGQFRLLQDVRLEMSQIRSLIGEKHD